MFFWCLCEITRVIHDCGCCVLTPKLHGSDPWPIRSPPEDQPASVGAWNAPPQFESGLILTKLVSFLNQMHVYKYIYIYATIFICVYKYVFLDTGYNHPVDRICSISNMFHDVPVSRALLCSCWTCYFQPNPGWLYIHR